MSTSDRFAGKVAVITGGTTGIGRAIARRFVSDGGKIVIGARHDTLFEEITQELGADNCWCQVCDVTNRAQVDALVQAAYDKFNGFDVMFGNAGINLFKDFLNVTEEEHARIVHNNYFGCFNSTQAAARAFVAHETKGSTDTPMVTEVPRTRFPTYTAPKLMIQRMAQPEEQANIACFLASDDASYITGETIFCVGGWGKK